MPQSGDGWPTVDDDHAKPTAGSVEESRAPEPVEDGSGGVTEELPVPEPAVETAELPVPESGQADPAADEPPVAESEPAADEVPVAEPEEAAGEASVAESADSAPVAESEPAVDEVPVAESEPELAADVVPADAGSGGATDELPVPEPEPAAETAELPVPESGPADPADGSADEPPAEPEEAVDEVPEPAAEPADRASGVTDELPVPEPETAELPVPELEQAPEVVAAEPATDSADEEPAADAGGVTDEPSAPDPEVVPAPPREEQKPQPVSWPTTEDEPDLAPVGEEPRQLEGEDPSTEERAEQDSLGEEVSQQDLPSEGSPREVLPSEEVAGQESRQDDSGPDQPSEDLPSEELRWPVPPPARRDRPSDQPPDDTRRLVPPSEESLQDQPPREQPPREQPPQEQPPRDQPLPREQPRQDSRRQEALRQEAERRERSRQEPRQESFRQETRQAPPWPGSARPDSARPDSPRYDPRQHAPGEATIRQPPGEATIRHDPRQGPPPGEATIRRPDTRRPDARYEATFRVPRPPLPPGPLAPPSLPPRQRADEFWDQQAPPRPPERAAPRADDAPAPRRKPLLITAAVVAVLALAAGVIFAVPGLSDTLGITDSEPDIAIEPPAPPVEFSPGLQAPGADAPAPTAAGVQSALAGPAAAPALGTLTGVVLDPASGETLWESDPTTPLVPASTTKLLTAAAALLSLDHTEQLVTKVVEGKDPGSAVIVGGGDPTLSSLKADVESVYPGAAHLSDLVDQVGASGTPVQSVHVDLSRYGGESLAPGWLRVDIGAGFIAPMVPLMLDGGRADARAQNGTRTDNPARAVAEEFANRLGASVPGSAEATAPEGAKVLGEVRSAPMVELVDTMLRTSDNVLAEAVAREVARKAGKEVSFAGAAEATREVLSANGFDLTGVELSDGSGLSTENRVPAALLAEILNLAAAPDGEDPRTAKLRPLLSGLPVAGGSGTLDDRYGSAETMAGKGYVRAKTGTLSGVNSLAGVILDRDGRVLVFALMTANTDSSARPALDAMVATVRACGCQ